MIHAAVWFIAGLVLARPLYALADWLLSRTPWFRDEPVGGDPE